MPARRILPLLLVLVSVALAGATAAQAGTKTVIAGPVGKTPGPTNLNGFYRRHLTVHVGSPVKWDIRGFHTVTFPAAGQAPPPFVSEDASKPISGVNDAAGNPFWFNGQPSLIFNPDAALPSGGSSYDGSELRNSGLPSDNGPPEPYRLRFTKTGTYRYLCLVHPRMRGTVKVVPAARKVASTAHDAVIAKRQSERSTRLAVRRAAFKGPEGSQVYIGHDRGPATVYKFFPAVKTVSVGQSVTFRMIAPNEVHTISFGPKDYLDKEAENIITPEPSQAGPPTLRLNPTVFLPSDPPAADPPPALPDYDGSNHGNGFLNSGVLDTLGDTPNPATSTIRFAKAGTYTGICLIHPFMRVTVKVK